MVITDIRSEQSYLATAAIHNPLAVRTQMPVRSRWLRVEKREVNRRAGSVRIRQVRNDKREPPRPPIILRRTRNSRRQPNNQNTFDPHISLSNK
jgi:hypothetical protein